MTPQGRTSWALGISLLIWAPVAFGILGGQIEVFTGSLYYLAALAISWVGTGVIAHITNTYRQTLDSAEVTKRQIERLEKQARLQQEDTMKRRESDKKTAADGAKAPTDDDYHY